MLTRIITGLVLIPSVVLLVLSASNLLFSIVVTIIVLIALWEYNSFVIVKSATSNNVTDRAGLIAVVLGVFVPALYAVYGAGILFPYLLSCLLVIIIVSTIGRESLEGSITEASLRFFGIVYIGVTLSHIIAFIDLDGGRLILLLVFVVVWSNDTFAYFGGKLLGKNKLAPSISPGKTIEGAVIGIIGGLLVGFAYNYYLVNIYHDSPVALDTLQVVIITLAVGVLSIVGDLVQSVIKRSSGVKDSGTIIPGHGGLLDRIDSLIFVVPAVYYYISFTY